MGFRKIPPATGGHQIIGEGSGQNNTSRGGDGYHFRVIKAPPLWREDKGK